MPSTTWKIETEGAAKDMTLTGVVDMGLVIVPWPVKYVLEPDITYGTAVVGSALSDIASDLPVAGVAGKDVTATTLADIRYVAGDAAMGIPPRTHYEPTLGYMFVFSGTVPQPVAPRFNTATVVANHLTNLFTCTDHGFDNGDTVSYHASSGGYPSGITAGRIYTVVKASDDVFALLYDKKPVDISNAGTGTHTVNLVTPVRLPDKIPNAVFVPMSWGPRLTNIIVP